jgi:hypothetical protein
MTWCCIRSPCIDSGEGQYMYRLALTVPLSVMATMNQKIRHCHSGRTRERNLRVRTLRAQRWALGANQMVCYCILKHRL